MVFHQTMTTANAEPIQSDIREQGHPMPKTKPIIPEFQQMPSHFNWQPPQFEYQQHGNANAISDLAKAMKDVFKEVKGGREWDPKDLPIFSGNPEDWPIFINEFGRTTPMGQISTSQNAIRLRKALKGSARDAVVGLLNDPSNIPRILKTLELSFGRPELVIRSLIKKADDCKAPDAVKPDSFVLFARNVVHLVESVKSLKQDRYLNDAMLLDKLVSKLPLVYSAEWMTYLKINSTLKNNLATFANWLEEKMEILIPLTVPSFREEKEAKGKGTRGSASVNASITDHISSKDDRGMCPCCEKGRHKMKNCFKFKKLSVDARCEIVKKSGSCFKCLEQGHLKKDCKYDKLCGKEDCTADHHFLLHFDKKSKPEKLKQKEEPSDNPSECKDSCEDDMNIGAVQSKSSKPLSIVKVRVKGTAGIRKAYALLDSGADTTLITSDLAKELGVSGRKVNTSCRGVGGTRIPVTGEEVSFEIAGTFRTAKFYSIKEAITMRNLGLAAYTQNVQHAKTKWPYMKKAKLENFSDVVPQIIIGEDHPYVTAHREILEKGENNPIAKRTLLGWVIAGKHVGGTAERHINTMSLDECQHLDNLLRSHFSLESYGVYPQNTEGSVEDRRALQILEETVKKTGNQWECGLLWGDPEVELPDSRPEAVSRLISNEKRMMRDKVFFTMYHQKMDEYLEKGYIQELTLEEERRRCKKTMYIPHFGVFNVNKPGKLRLVFDAACRNDGVSLNEHLLTGPDLIRPLPAVLMNFRIHNIAINGDIEDMFHRVGMREADRDSQRFVWRDLRIPADQQKIKTFTMNVLIFGACSSPASAIYVKNRNAEDFKKKYPDAVKAVHEDFYCDDFLGGAPTVAEALKLKRQICEINQAGNFFVKKWLSNNKEVLCAIPEDERAKGVKGFGTKTEVPTERILGVQWCPEEDYFTFSTNFKKIDPTLLDGRRPTKREMCSLLMSVFDPLGFLANFKIKGLVLLQRTWRTDINWDDEIPDCIYSVWKNWVNSLKETESVKVPRLYCKDIHLASSIQLHTLVDASAEACSAICFLRITIGENVQVAFVCAKTKVAPTKKLTIPRLELTAAVMGAILADTIMDQLKLPIRGRLFWCDSKTVLMWIRSESLRYKEFVANRVNKIHLLSSVSEWRWIPSAVNVADLGTRVESKIHLGPDSLWLTGPEFLKMETDKWPIERKQDAGLDDVAMIEMKKINVFAAGMTYGSSPVPTVKMERFSDFLRMCRAQAAVIRAARHWLNKTKGVKLENFPWVFPEHFQLPRFKKEISPIKFMGKVGRVIRVKLKSLINSADFKLAEAMLIRIAQQEDFGEDILALKSGKFNRGNKLWKLNPFLEDDILKLRGRICNADVAEGVKFPVILPPRHVFTRLLILKEHERNGHQGHNTVLNSLRSKYWIVEGRAAVRRVILCCQPCKLGKAKPIIPRMGDLPHHRLSSGQPPFTYTGLDLFGPLQVVVGRHHEKRWTCLFTCMVTRAVHLEVVYGLTTDETMMALSRFTDQRGRPHHLYSDNGTNYVGASRELHKCWSEVDWNSIMGQDRFREIRWHFSPPASPHFGGAWERMVQSVKKILKKTLIETFPKDQTLLTMLKGAENIINSRPLTYLSDDPSDPNPLTPNHFLRGFSDIGPSIPGEYEPSDEVLRAQWRRAQYFLDKFWQRWTKEVLPELLRREKWHADAKPIEVGDVVLLVDDQSPRNVWRKAVVKGASPGKDGQVRIVEVETSDFSTRKKTTYRRGVDKIIPLGLKMGKSGEMS